jgi:hypothetical protein
VKEKRDAASDHAAVWVDIDIQASSHLLHGWRPSKKGADSQPGVSQLAGPSSLRGSRWGRTALRWCRDLISAT